MKKRLTGALTGVAGMAAIAGTLVITGAPASADGPGVGTPYVVSVGDSFISGEAGRWAGNTNTGQTNIDAGGANAYWDNAGRTAEEITRCHRSESAEVHIGGVGSKNLACSGSKTGTFSDSDGNFKPGVDFYLSGTRKGQARMLQEFATSHNVKTVALSIGGNNFNFGGIIQQCVQDFLLSPSWFKDYCKDDSSVTKNFTAANVTTQTTNIRNAIGNLRTAMANAGYSDSQYTIVVQNYPSPLSTSGSYRYGESGFGRQRVGGCGFWNSDANWAHGTAVSTINGAVSKAVTDTNRTNVKLLDLSGAFLGRRLCENTVGLLEEKGLSTWRGAGAVDKTEWVNQIRTLSTVGGDYYVQESIHPNYWGQLALRNCLRSAYNGGAARGGRCERGTSTGVNGNGEPNMRFTAG